MAGFPTRHAPTNERWQVRKPATQSKKTSGNIFRQPRYIALSSARRNFAMHCLMAGMGFSTSPSYSSVR